MSDSAARSAAVGGEFDRAAVRRLRVQDLETVPPEHVQYLNTLYSAGEYVDDGHVFRCTHQDTDSADHWVRLSAGRDRMWLGLGAARADPAIDFDWRECSGDLRLVAWAASFHVILDALAVVFGRDWIPDAFVARSDLPDRCVRIGFALRTKHAATATGCLALAKPLPLTAPSRPIEPGAPIRRLPLRIPLTVDRLWLSAGRLRDLAIGSVICIRRAAFLDIGARLTLRVGATTLIVRAAATTLRIVSVSSGSGFCNQFKETNVSEKANEPSGDDKPVDSRGPVDVDSMPVELCFHAGHLATNYAELRAIRPGYVFELGLRLCEQPIEITANGALIGRGELVAVGDQVGVRITALGCSVDPG